MTTIETCTRGEPQVQPLRRIGSLLDLRLHLQRALELEHATLPPYLCALYSLDPHRNQAPKEVIGSVVVEEMLHMTLVANLLNAVGGRPRLDTPHMLPGYPQRLPLDGSDLVLGLAPFGTDALGQFMNIERPAQLGAVWQNNGGSPTISAFYDEIERGLRDLCAFAGEWNVFYGDPSRQVADEHIYGGSGRVIPVDNLATAVTALREIVEQGEGANHVQVWDGDRDMFHPERDEVGHYYRFQELECGRRYRRGDTPQSGPTGDAISIDWDAVQPMQCNPRTAHHAPGSAIRTAQERFNTTYSTLLQRLDAAFDGRPQLLADAIPLMFDLKAHAQALMHLPTDNGLTTAGPTFEYVVPESRH